MPIDAPPLNPRRSLLGAQVETTKGTKNAPTSPLSGTTVFGARMTPQDVFPAARQPDANTTGNFRRPLTVRTGQLTFQTEVREGDQTATLLTGCGYVGDGASPETFTPSVDYANHKTFTFVQWEAGRKKILYGASGSVVFQYDNVGEQLIANWTFQGIFDDVVDEDMPSHTVDDKTGFQAKGMSVQEGATDDPIPRTAGGQIDLSVTVDALEDVEDAQSIAYFVAVPGSPTISLAPEATTVANYDAFGDFFGAGQKAFDLIFTNPSTATTFQFTALAAQRISIADGVRGDVLTDPVDLECQVTNGDDQLEITPAA